MIVAVPGPAATTTPASLTLATSGLLLDQVTARSDSARPLADRGVARICVLSPIQRSFPIAVTSTRATRSGGATESAHALAAMPNAMVAMMLTTPRFVRTCVLPQEMSVVVRPAWSTDRKGGADRRELWLSDRTEESACAGERVAQRRRRGIALGELHCWRCRKSRSEIGPREAVSLPARSKLRYRRNGARGRRTAPAGAIV